MSGMDRLEKLREVQQREGPSTGGRAMPVTGLFSMGAAMSNSRTEYLLAELRCPAVRARLWVNEIDAIGAALRAGWIDPDEAIAAIADSGCLHLLAPAEERA